MDDLSSRFLTAFNKIEQYLRKLCKAKPAESFARLVTQGAEKNAAVHRNEHDLKQFGDLRNAIVHRYEGRPLATPHEGTVDQLESLAKRILAPPKVGKLFTRKVKTCSPDDSVGDAIKSMFEHDFSQLPVYDNNRLVSLLTTDTVARWLGDCLHKEGGVVLDDTPVKAVLKFAEYDKNYKLLAPNATVYDALDEFDKYVRLGRQLDAILITKDHSKSQKPTGLITAFDIPKLHESM